MVSLIKIEGLFSFSLSLSLKKVNIIVGEHGIGKTMLFNVLTTALTPFTSTPLITDMNMLFSLQDDIAITIDNDVIMLKPIGNAGIVISVNGDDIMAITPYDIVCHKCDYNSIRVGYIPQIIPVIHGESVAKIKLNALYDMILHDDFVIVDDIDAHITDDDVEKVVNMIKKSKSQLITTVYRNNTVRTFLDGIDKDNITLVYIGNKGYRQYSGEEISGFEKPLHWIGYI
ncbi:ABC transporter [Sulfolobales Beppu filamentous virus 3]|uniref:ABC transporter n=1 Tax=Sulfolobales Beppu filamentous virus 3 TaxID=2493124 RepID=A0A3S8NF54_9VIRU|nr:ABC transporter [Sulfolobales Beppu filamentous virus 3]AZI75884.1 ABC transporter [Sulfolobales Beppu filamentous virus 3]